MNAAHALRIRRRNLDFGMRGPVPVHWLGGDGHRTRFFDAMSIMFPEGERAFIESVQHYRQAVRGDTQLAADVDAFIGQEALHSREHHRYNARLAAAGAPVSSFSLLRFSLLRIHHQPNSPVADHNGSYTLRS